MPSLHDLGWRQGTIFEADLVATSYVYEEGEVIPADARFSTWVVVSQDCDLASVETDSNEPTVEVQPVVSGQGGGGWGIRSRVIRLSEDEQTSADLPKLRISPAALTVYGKTTPRVIDESRAVALKTWLGLRYDRPAVPEILVELARAIAEAIKRHKTVALAENTHDVLFSATEERPARFQLIAVITDIKHATTVTEWLAKAALEVDPSLGALDSPPEALTKNDLSLEDIENTFSADLSNISWSKPVPRGAL